MILKKALEFAIEQVASLVDSPQVDAALRVVIPQVVELANLDRWDAEARGHVQATVDDALRSIGAI